MLTLQAQMKELLRESDELRMSRDEAVNGAKETEKKLKTMEADALHFQEVWKLQLISTLLTSSVTPASAASALLV